MKKIIFSLLFSILLFSFNAKADKKDSTAISSLYDSLKVQRNTLKKYQAQVDSTQRKLNETLAEYQNLTKDLKDDRIFTRFMVCLPLILSFIVGWIVLRTLRNEYKLSDALSRDNPGKDADGKDLHIRSSARLTMFLSSMGALIITISLTCFYIYAYLKFQKEPDFTNLLTLAITLGIGVVPYSVNKIWEPSTSETSKIEKKTYTPNQMTSTKQEHTVENIVGDGGKKVENSTDSKEQ